MHERGVPVGPGDVIDDQAIEVVRGERVQPRPRGVDPGREGVRGLEGPALEQGRTVERRGLAPLPGLGAPGTREEPVDVDVDPCPGHKTQPIVIGLQTVAQLPAAEQLQRVEGLPQAVFGGGGGPGPPEKLGQPGTAVRPVGLDDQHGEQRERPRRMRPQRSAIDRKDTRTEHAQIQSFHGPGRR